ncbi:MAG TPA: hypothetical protein VKZ79_11670 [Alphaproteobacteria bacterium]|nr:hypothetical protein [Alphaproteobacteria bacterium]
MARLGLSRNSDIEELLGLLGDPNEARAIGEACAKAIGETSARKIARTLPVDTSALRARIREDFAKDRIIIADGWVLSATEARLYALAAWSGAAHRE